MDADVSINLSDYLIFPTMEETLREIVPLVQHRRRDGISVVRMYLDDINDFAKEEPVYVVDGIMTDDTEYFMSLNPLEIQSIKVIYNQEKLQALGSIGQNGVILVETKIHNNEENVKRSPKTFSISGLNPALPFNHGHNVQEDEVRTPSLIASLYWNPNITLDSTGEATISFNTSDVTGHYRMEIFGVTDSGLPITGSATFTVKYSPEKTRK